MLLGPLTYIGFGGCAILAASLGLSMMRSNKLGEDLYRERAAYAIRVAEAETATAAAEAKYRKREQDMAAELAALQVDAIKANDKLSAARARASAATQQLRDAERAYVAIQASRTSKDPAASSGVNAAAATMFQQLHRETDDFAQLAAGSADSLAAQLMLLQHYVRDVCHN